MTFRKFVDLKMWHSVVVLWLVGVCLSQVTGRNDSPETPSPTPESSTPSPTVTSLASSAPPPSTVDETLFTTSGAQTPDATAIANQPRVTTPCVPISPTNAVPTTEQSQTTMHSEFPPTLVPATTDPTSTLVPATTDPTLTLVPATTDPTSTLVPATTDPTSTLVPATTGPTSTLVPAITGPTSTLVPATTGPTSTLVPATTGPTSTLVPATTDPTSTLVPATTDPTSTLVPATTEPTPTLVPATTDPTSTLVPATTDPTSTLVPATTEPTPTLVSATAGPTSTLVPATTGPTSTLVPATTGPTSTLVPATTGPTSTLVPATTGPTSTLVPATTGPTSTLRPATTGPTSTLVPATTGPTSDQPQTTMNSALTSLIVSATTVNFPTSDQPTTTAVLSATSNTAHTTDQPMTTLTTDMTSALVSATLNSGRGTTTELMAKEDQTLASTKAPLPKGTSVSGNPIHEPSLTPEERILRLMESTKLTDRLSFKPPNYDRAVDGTWKLRLSLDLRPSSPDEIHRNLTILLTGTVGFISMAQLELNSTSDGVEAVYEITYSTRDLLSRLPDVKDRFLFALATVPADILHSVRSVEEVFDTGVESLCVQQQLCPDGYLCHVINQLTCISMCDVTECGDHGRCALNQTFQPICICDAGGTTVYFGDRCEFGREQLAISWRPAAVAGLATGAAVVTGLLMAVALYLWWVWKGRRPRVSPRATHEISEQQVVMKGDNSPLQPELELPNTSLH